MSEWVITKLNGKPLAKSIRVPARPVGQAKPSRKRVSVGAVAKQRQREAERELSKRRQELLRRVANGEVFETPRTHEGDAVERLHDVEPSAPVASTDVMPLIDVPGARVTRRDARSTEKAGRVGYESVLRQRRIVNGRPEEDDFGGDVLAHDVRRL